RLARAGKKVCLLERGREITLGEFPESAEALARELQFEDDTGQNRLGLFDLHADTPVSVMVGCGLGGTSLINANVSIEPDPRVFLDGRWPAALVKDLGSLQLGYARARDVLQPKPFPETVPPLGKLEAHRLSAQRMGREKDFRIVELNVRFEDGPNAVGEEQKKCTLCGNCASGCNAGSKGALTMNYLPDARVHGATLVTQAQVRHVARAGSRWAVHFVPVEDRVPLDPGTPTQFVLADVVVVAAGAIGSTEILLRSGRLGLPLSSQVGLHFSGNGDQLSFAYDSDRACNGLGWTPGKTRKEPGVGPTITSAIYIRGETVNEDVLIEEGAIPASLGGAAPWALALTSFWEAGHLPAWLGVKRAASMTQTYLIM
ncbi:MAG: GMC family oxidoreductase N-terminal domain-containing protein, partial [Polyangiaceae bacterium]